jgi:hypothetical protein
LLHLQVIKIQDHCDTKVLHQEMEFK